MTSILTDVTEKPTAYRIVVIKSDSAYLMCEGIEEPNVHVALVYRRPDDLATIQFEDGSTYLGIMTGRTTGRTTEQFDNLALNSRHTHIFMLMDEKHAFFRCDNLGRP